MLFWGTILSSTLSAGPSTSEVKRHKVLSTSKSLALFCSGLVILLANEASEAIRHEYRVPGAVLARRRCSAPRLRARTAAAASSQAAAGGARCRRGSSSVAGGARCRRGSSSVAGGTRCRRRLCGVAHSFSDVRQTASVSTTEAAAYISAAAAGAHT